MNAMVEAAPVRGPKTNIPPDLPPLGAHGPLDIAYADLADPNPSLRGQKQRTAVNVNHDVLEREHKSGRLSPTAYAAGRLLQEALERVSGHPTGGGQWSEGDRVDVALSADVRMVRLIDNARKANALIAEIQPVVGQFAMAVLQEALVKREGFVEIALHLRGVAQRGRPRKHEVYHVAETFRTACKSLAQHWGARGKGKRDESVAVVATEEGDDRAARVRR